MDKKLLITTITILGTISLIGFIILGSLKNNPNTNQNPNEVLESTSTQTPNTVNTKNLPEVTYFYKADCPYCGELKKFIAENSVEDYVFILNKPIDTSRANQLDLTKKSRACGLDINSVGVPFVVVNDECFMGYPNIVKKLEEFIL